MLELNDEMQKVVIMQAVSIIITLITSITAIIVARLAHQTKTQVKNEHSTNLRDDLDRIRDTVDDVKSSVEHVIRRNDTEFALLWRYLKRK